MSGDAPKSIGYDGDDRAALRLEWPDGHVSSLPLVYLRGWCPCAECQGHGPGRGWIKNDGPELTGLEPMGNYAMGLRFADGHATFVRLPAVGIDNDNIYTLMTDEFDILTFNRIHGEAPICQTPPPYPGMFTLGPGPKDYSSTDSLIYP